MSILNLTVDTITRKLLDNNQAPVFVINDVNVNKIRFGIQNGFPDIDVSENTAFRVMYIPPGTNKTVQSKTLSFYTNNGFYSYYDWDMESTVFQSSGILTVALCIFKNGTEVQGWHTVPYQIFVAGSIHTDDGDSSDETITPTVLERVAVLESVIQRIAFGAPIVVSNISDMTDIERIYVLTTDENWYYYDGTEWAVGGEYGAITTDGRIRDIAREETENAVGDATEGLQKKLDSISGAIAISDLNITAEGNNSSSYNRHLFSELTVVSGQTYTLDFTFTNVTFRKRTGNVVFKVATASSASYNYLVDTIVNVTDSFSARSESYIFTATGNASHLYVYCYTPFNTPIDITVNVKSITTLAEVDRIYDTLGKSIFGNPINLELSTTYNYSATSRNLGVYRLTAGTYIFLYNQNEGAVPSQLSARCTPWYTKTGGPNIYRKANATSVERYPGNKYWIINIDVDDDYTFYFWYRLTTLLSGGETAHITNIQLFKIDSVKGNLYNCIAKDESLEEIPFSYITMYQRIGCIGDSWTAGSIYESEDTWAGTLDNLAWCRNAERFTGSKFIQYAKGGLSARTWLTDIHGKIAVESTQPCPLYVINLGINDATELTDGVITLGNVTDFENDVTGTFFYYYGAVVDCVRTHAPTAKIILETILMRAAQQIVVRNAIIEYAEYYNIPYVDMYADPFYRSSSVVLVGGHPTAGTHAGMAMANLRLFAKCIRENPDYFKINTQSEFGDFSLLGIADSIGRNYISIPSFYSRPANTSHSSTGYAVGRAFLLKGKYILKWHQTSATKMNSDSRCTPIYCFVGDSTNRFYSGNSDFPNTSEGDYRWVFNVESDSTILIYFWSKFLVEDFTASNFDLYSYDSVRGRLDRLEGLIT